MSDPVWDAAGTAVGEHADKGVEFIGTYGIPALLALLGIGFVWSLTKRIGKGVRSGV